MAEAEWQSCQDPVKILAYLCGRASDRKRRPFAVACCRRLWDSFSDKRGWKAIEFAERYADGLATTQQLRDSAWGRADEGTSVVLWDARQAARISSEYAIRFVARSGVEAGWEEQKCHACLLRCINGNPFKPTSSAPAVLASQGGLVVRMATAIYNDRRWEDMPLLGDCLEDAG